MAMSRRGFLKFLCAAGSVFLMGKTLAGGRSLFAEEEKGGAAGSMYKLGDTVPKAGRYQCVVCGFIVEYLPKHIERGVAFGMCTVCLSGTENGPKKPNEEFWKYIEA